MSFDARITTVDAATLPTPIARAVVRAQRAVQTDPPAAVYLPLRYVFEATLKTWTTVAVGAASVEDPGISRLWPTLLAADSLGPWAQALRDVTMRPRRWPSAMNPFRVHLSHKLKPQEPLWTAFETRHDLLPLLGETQESAAYANQALGVIDFLVFLRNRGPGGHGAHHDSATAELSAFLDRTLAALLSQAPAGQFVLSVPLPSRGETTTTNVLDLVGCSPMPHGGEIVLRFAHCMLVLTPSGDEPLVLPPLIRFNAETDRCYCPNGGARTNDTQYIDYATGDLTHLAVPPDALRVEKGKPSLTAGAASLVRTVATWHNVPNPPTDYVHRSTLEGQLLELISDNKHRIVNVQGPGGAGKTTLVLATLNKMMSTPGFPFAYVIWCSARDIDLSPHATQQVRREIRDWPSSLDLACRLVLGDAADPLTSEERQQTMREELGGSCEQRYLVVIDNFETLDDASRAYRDIDSTIGFPCKAVITTRSREFEGDYRLPVTGLDPEEATELALREARSRHCEPVVAARGVLDQMMTITGRYPYQLKVLVALMAGGTQLSDMRAAMAGKADVLQALFERGFHKTNRAGQSVFLALAQVARPVQVVVLHVASAWARIEVGSSVDVDVKQGVNACRQFSLVEESVDPTLGAIVGLTVPAVEYGRAALRIHPEALEVRLLADKIGEVGLSLAGRRGPSATIQSLREAALGGRLSPQRVASALEAVGAASPELADEVAATLDDVRADAARVDAAFRTAFEVAPTGIADRLERYAAFKRRIGQPVEALSLLVQSIEASADDHVRAERLAKECNGIIVDHKQDLPPERRGLYTRILIDNLERANEAQRLTADGHAILGWTYLQNIGARTIDRRLWLTKAREIASKGLRMDPENGHCKNVLERIGRR